MEIHITRKCVDTNENEIAYIKFKDSFLDFYKHELTKIDDNGYEIISSNFEQDNFKLILFRNEDGSTHVLNAQVIRLAVINNDIKCNHVNIETYNHGYHNYCKDCGEHDII